MSGILREGLTLLGLILAVALADTVTKLALHTPDWGWHAVSPADPLGPLVVGMLFLLLPFGRCPLAVALGGAWSNAVWTHTGPVANPFVARLDDGFGLRDLYAWDAIGQTPAVAYNLADVAITVGTWGFAVCAVLYSVKLWRRALRRRRAMRPRVRFA